MTGNWKLRLRDRKEDFVAIFVVAERSSLTCSTPARLMIARPLRLTAETASRRRNFWPPSRFKRDAF